MLESTIIMPGATSNRRETATEDDLLLRASLRLSRNILGFVLGILSAVTIFVATNILVLKGGDLVGPHLGLLAQYFLGYSVSFAGSLVGAAYGFAVGYLSGAFIAWVYNVIASRPKASR